MLIGNRESDPLVAAGIAGENGGVDADQMAFVIHQRAAGVAGIDRSVRLDEIFHLLDSQSAAAGCAHDSCGYRLADAERIADGQTRCRRPRLCWNRPASAVGKFDPSILSTAMSVRGSVPITRAFNLSLVMQGDGDFLGAVHYVVVGQNVAFGADDDARSKSFLGSLLRYVETLPEVIAEKLAEEGIDALRRFPSPFASLLSTMKC